MKVLVVEDDRDLADQITDALRQAGYTVETAHDGETGEFLGATETVALSLTPDEQAHVLLADDVRYPRLAAQATGADPFAWLVAQLDVATPVAATCHESVVSATR